jgi:ParB family transcriptional regulator, chromosome partitioning protein
MPSYETLPRGRILPPTNPMRVGMDEGKLAELAESIRLRGILFPLLVTPATYEHARGSGAIADTAVPEVYSQNPCYEIIDGHRRWVASGMVGLADLPVRIFDNVEECRYAIMLEATSCHEDFSPYEEGVQFLELAEKYSWNMDQLTRHFGKSEAYINERVRLIQGFPDVSELVRERKITWAQARIIMKVPRPERRAYLLEQAGTHGASTRNLTVMVDQWRSEDQLAAGGPKLHTPEHGQPIVHVVEQRCLWCDRADDQANMIQTPMHSYHHRDLVAFLRDSGVNRQSPTIPQRTPGNAESADTR